MDASGNTAMEATRVLHQALSELEHVKQSLRQPFMCKNDIAASLQRLENGLKKKAQDLLYLGTQQPSQGQSMALTFKSKLDRAVVNKQLPSAVERAMAFKASYVERPTTDIARAYLQEHFGVPLPGRASLSSARLVQPGSGNGALAKGLSPTAVPGVILPRYIREDSHAIAPPEVTDLEVEKGLLHVVNRRLLPIKANLTPALYGTNGPYKTGTVPVYPHEAQFWRPVPTSALEDSMLAATSHIKLDLLTPVVMPAPSPMLDKTLSRVEIAGGPRPRTPPETSTLTATSTALPIDTAARHFDVLMDTFSLHQFMIRKGHLVADTPEFESYRRTFEPLWHQLHGLIVRLEALCAQYVVPLALVNGKALAQLADAMPGYEPGMEDLLLCLLNLQEVAEVLRKPGRRFLGPGGQHEAAATIQSHYKGHLARRKFSRKGRASMQIQAAWRNCRLRQQLRDKLQQARTQRNVRFQELSQQLASQWPLLQANHHVVVHVPSLPRPDVRGGCSVAMSERLLLLEAAQLGRLCDLSEPLLDLILVLPSPPDAEVINYWNKILEVGGVHDPTNRYRIVYPENHQRLPTHMSTTSRLLASPRALKRIRIAVQGRLAYLVPGGVAEAEVDLAVQLGIPLMAGAPSTATVLGCKSAARVLFQSASLNTAPGIDIEPAHRADATATASTSSPHKRTCSGQKWQQQWQRQRQADARAAAAGPLKAGTQFSLTSDGSGVVIAEASQPNSAYASTFAGQEERILLRLAQLMINNPTVRRWLMKLDDEMFGNGHAYFDIATIHGSAEVLDRVQALGGAADISGLGESAPPLSSEQQVGMYRLFELLRKQLPHQLISAASAEYPTYRGFMAALAQRGGVLEACPHEALGSPMVNIFVDPTGAVNVLSTHEKVFCYPYRAMGSTFPQSSVPHQALLEAATAAGMAAFHAGLIGHMCLDFVTSRDLGGALRLWAVDLTPGIAPSLVTYQLFDFLTVGSFDPVAGMYTVELDPLDAEPSTFPQLPQLPADSDSDDGFGSGPNATPTHRIGGGSNQRREVQAADAAGLSVSSSRPGASSSPSAQMASAPKLGASLRTYCVLDILMHPAIRAAPCSKFFHACWQQGLCFDVDLRVGCIFNLSDRYTSGVLGVLCVGMTLADAYAQLHAVLKFVAGQEAETVRSKGGKTALLGDDVANFQDLQSLVMFLAQQA